MKGTVTRRFLVTYPVPPEALEFAVPPGGELVLHNGLAWVSACFVHLAGMRPSWVPEILGTDFNYLIHRTMAWLPYPDGKRRSTVLVLEANINRPLLGVIARKTTGVRFRIRDITLDDLDESWIVRMKEGQNVLYEAEIDKRSIGQQIDARSQFANASEADRFLLGISFGAQWEPESRQIKLLAETFPARLERGAGLPNIERLGYLAEHAQSQLSGMRHLVLVGAKAPVSFRMVRRTSAGSKTIASSFILPSDSGSMIPGPERPTKRSMPSITSAGCPWIFSGLEMS